MNTFTIHRDAEQTFSLPTEITHDQATACASRLSEQLQSRAKDASNRPVVIDAGNLQNFDSSALAVLLACRRQVTRCDRRMVVAHMPKKLRDLAALYGVSDLLPAQ